VHLRDPGQTHKEDLITGTNAAAAGGVTSVVCMPNTAPVLDSPELIQDVVERAKSCKVKVHPCASITKGLLGKVQTDFRALKRAGAVAVSDDGMPVMNSYLMSNAVINASNASLRLISHSEDLGIKDTRESENIAVERDVGIAESTFFPVHIAHVSTKEAVDYIRGAKSYGTAVTCEAAPHHFTLTAGELTRRDADYRMNPPLREQADIEAIIEGLADNTIDCIASDHAPHSPDEKADFDNAPNGVLGLETILAVSLTQLYHSGRLPLSRIVELLCVNPRKILKLKGGSFTKGMSADIAVVDLNEEWVVVPDKLHSKSRNTCFKGMTLKGKVKYTLADGEIIYTDGGL
jgi:dihydroorotase